VPAIVWHQHSEIVAAGEKSIRRFISKLRMLSFFADNVCPVFKGQEKVLLDRGIAINKIHTLYNGVNLKRFDISVDRDKILSDFGIAKTNKIIISICKLIERKGLDYLLAAARQIINCHPDVRFLVVGQGPLLNKLKITAQESGIENKVIFVGMRSDVNVLLLCSDVFVLSALAEAFPFVNLEAMAARRPVVATNVGGIPEIVISGETGFLVPPKDPDSLAKAVIKLLENPEMASLMGEKARKMVEAKFTIENAVAAYMQLYLSIA
jgi:glycosyltransferase involved in cell wall biosynthesis